MNNTIKYQMNLTLNEGTVLKAYQTVEDSKKHLKIDFLLENHSKAYLTKVFNAENAENFATIYKTTKEGLFVTTFENYVGNPSVYEGSVSIPVITETEIQTTKEVLNADTGEVTIEPITTIVSKTEDVNVNIVTVELKYVSPTEQKVAKLESLVAPTIDVDTCTLDELKMFVQRNNSQALERYLENNPMLHTDGKYYGVATDDRNEMNQQYTAYLLIKSKNPAADDVVKWHSKGSKCEPMPVSDFRDIALSIYAYAEPYYEKMQEIKEAIMACATKEDILKIKIFGEV